VRLPTMQAAPQRRDTGVDVHHGAAREVQHAPVPEERARAGPGHVADGRIDQHQPERREDKHRGELHAFREGAADQRRRDDEEGELEHDENRFRIGARQAVHRHVLQEHVVQVAHERAEVDHAPRLGFRNPKARLYPQTTQMIVASAVIVKHCIKTDSTFLERTRPP
jgi:hypothetical protein